jgi:transposase
VFGLGPATRIYVALGATDMRKGYDGLYDAQLELLELEPGVSSAEVKAESQRDQTVSLDFRVVADCRIYPKELP